MPVEERLEVRLPALEKAADHEGEKSGEEKEDDDENVGDRRGEVADDFALGDGQNVMERHARRLAWPRMIPSGPLAFPSWLRSYGIFPAGFRQRDAAEDFVEPAFFGVQFLDFPALGERERADRPCQFARRSVSFRDTRESRTVRRRAPPFFPPPESDSIFA